MCPGLHGSRWLRVRTRLRKGTTISIDLGPWPEEIATRAEFSAALTDLRESAGLTVRELARRVGLPAATMGGWFSGRHLPSPAQFHFVRTTLAECGVTDTDAADAWFDALRRARTASDHRVRRASTPYPGLESLTSDDADRFFGRDDETGQILKRIAALHADPGPSGGTLVVLGPSGSGKSSILRAGVAAAIRRGDLDTPEVRWTCDVTTPDAEPITALALDDGPRVIIVDQLEEILTSGQSVARRRVLTALRQLGPGVVAVLGLRADFYAEAVREPLLRAALQHSQVLVGPMGREGVEAAIVRPAEQAGVAVEDGFVDVIMADFAPRDSAGNDLDSGALPLLSHALLSTWEHSNGRRLTIEDYRAIGGIDGAVQRTAEDLYAALTPAEQDVARRVFLRLVNIDDDDIAITRRRIAIEELDTLVVPEGVSPRSVIDQFIQRRLITAGDGSVEISHEALLSAWPRLFDWIDNDRGGLRLHRILTNGANLWEASGRDDASLARGARLELIAEWADDSDHELEMNVLEREFLDDGLRAVATARRLERKRRTRLKSLLAVVAVLALVAAGLAVYGLHARTRADRAASTVRAQKNAEVSRRLALQSAQIERTNLGLSEQLAIAAYQISPTSTARVNLINQSTLPAITRVAGAGGPAPLALSPDGSLTAVGRPDGSVDLFTQDVDRVPTLQGHIPAQPGTESVQTLAFNRSGVLAVGFAERGIELWAVTGTRQPRLLSSLPTRGSIASLAISPNGLMLAAAISQVHRPLKLWDITRPGQPANLTSPTTGTPTNVGAVAFSRDGRQFAAGGYEGVVTVWPTRSIKTTTPATFNNGSATVTALSFDRAGSTLYSGDRNGKATVWDLTEADIAGETPKTLRVPSGSPIQALAVSPDGDRLMVGSTDGTVGEWSPVPQTLVRPIGVGEPVSGLAYTPDGGTVLAASADGTLTSWHPTGRTIGVNRDIQSLTYTADGSHLAVGSNTGLQLWSTNRPNAPTALGRSVSLAGQVGIPDDIDGKTAITSNGALAAAGTFGGMVGLWDQSDPGNPKLAGPPFATRVNAPVNSMAFNLSGTLLAIGSAQNELEVWNVTRPRHPTLAARARLKYPVNTVAFSPTHQLLAAATSAGVVDLWDVSSAGRPSLLTSLNAASGDAVAFSPDGRTLAATGGDQTTRLWDVDNPHHVTKVGHRLAGPNSYSSSLSFSPDGRQLAVGSNDGSVWIYPWKKTHPSKSATRLDGLVNPVLTVAFSRDGETLISGALNLRTAVWSLDPQIQIGRVCAVAGESITKSEWRTYVSNRIPYDPPCQK